MSNSQAPEVTTTAGTVRGIQRDASAAFLGIPFAEPPVGELRFAAPVPHHAWEGVRDATEYGATPQRKALSEVTLIPEPSIPGDSTLNVNVFTPRPGETDAKLPVLVYIHGGGFVAGSPASPWYDGAAFNRDGVVTVSVSYRLGFDGFGWIEDAPHNRGILDWILALEWVRDNIGAFGGDPSRVTIAGQSAGGGAVLTLLAVPRAAGLFHGAISLSGPASDVPLESAETLGRRLAQLGGVAPTRAGLATLDEARILELQGQVSSIGAAASDDDAGTGADADDNAGDTAADANPLAGIADFISGGLTLAPVVDGELLPESAASALEHGVGADKALMLGTVDNEFNMMMMGGADALAEVDPVAALGAFRLPPEVATAYVEAHSGIGTAGILGQAVTDLMFRRFNRALAEARAAAGAPAWLYRFSWPSPSMGGAVHCTDVPFFFDCLGAERVDVIAGPTPPTSLAADVHGAAVRFITTSNPGWPAYATPDRDVRVYDVPSSVLPDGYGDVAVLGEQRLGESAAVAG
ncbi:carboxylesterase/lipase family protein [Rathayibacter soli]|uniref:carboxylesterase/lipase family protein n=1 Tax=Rathayibacter soli TaxID=3144168 RepID=UPI0027E5575C|nr:carboxylesterase family protein [Glaciibacter superstes]